VVVCQTVRIFVAFKRQESASKAKADLDGRFFGGRTVTATFYDEESFAAGKLAP
jgi:splicing factor 45